MRPTFRSLWLPVSFVFACAACSGGGGGSAGDEDTGAQPDTVDGDTTITDDADDDDVGIDPATDLGNLLGVGELCEDFSECQTALCFQLEPDIPGFCSSYCFDEGDCPDADSWDCVFLRNSGGDAANVCVPNDFCIDDDEDGFGRGPGCDGPDCDDENDAVNTQADEVCDGIDNDCDGNIDDNPIDTNISCETGFLGPCEMGTSFCIGGLITCEPARQPSAELCDGVDNDCDGNLDEDEMGTPLAEACYAGPMGTAGVGLCAEGVRTCAMGGFGTCMGQILPLPELCDAMDNDCDGMSDEGMPGEGVVCETGELGECGAGITSCAADGAITCVPNLTATDEVCDGRDNDCDGTIDENAAETGPLSRPCYDGPDGTIGVGTCAGGTSTCVAGTFGTCDGDVIPTIELCNSDDDDCDGSVNEGDPAAGFNCNTGLLGVCAFGQTICGMGDEVCVAQFDPDPEICDGLDNDCDGDVDENAESSGPLTRACYDGPMGTEDVGPCIGGEQVCLGGNFSTCQDQVLPAPTELCDGIDNDCNGMPDDGDPGGGQLCNTGLNGVCATGTTTCNVGTSMIDCVADVMATSEVCDGLDNDCDGVTDNGALWADLDEICSDGTGQCLARGTRICDPADPMGATVCSATAGTGGSELCNGLDDDCDGTADEDATWSTLGTGCTSGQGVCQTAGVFVCDTGDPSGAPVCSASPPAGGTELCDGLDNDCDGMIDEDMIWSTVGSPCTAGQGVCETAGVFVCDAGDPSGAPVCSASPPSGSSELCDGLDNDCDGSADEDATWNNLGTVCTVGQGLCSRNGVFVCDGGDPAGAAVCNATPGATATEICDGLDNDCDGSDDEDAIWNDLGTACSDGQGVCLERGARICDTTNPAGPTVCSATASTGGTEICDGLDNDCDGDTDEGALWVTLGDGCTSGQGVCEAGGVLICDPGDANGPPVCSATPGSSGSELCDSLDNDCDGSVDEDMVWDNLGTPCQSGQGVCQTAGVFVCNPADRAGSAVCDASPPSGSAELCDGLDNDCDGAADEDATWNNLGSVCSVGQGLCERNGVFVCDGGNTAGPAVCNASPGASATEICDGLDNDCDGGADEDAIWANQGTACTDGLGLCQRTGVFVCDATDRSGGTVCNANPPAGTGEICDGLDNDCDGSADEDAVWNTLGNACSQGQGVCQRAGVFVCDTSDRSGVPVCNANPPAGGTEICDGLDNDCDGTIDDGPLWSNLGNACSSGQGTCAVAGTFVCNSGNPAGATVCSATPDPAGTEVCDGFDNDCDGMVDNNLTPPLCPLQDGVCMGARQVCAGAAGLLSCNSGNYGSDYEVTEVSCDGQDNDCDGTPDNVDLDNDGFIDVACGGTDCDDNNPTVYPGAPEICGDALDNDCNMVADDKDVDGDGFIDVACGGDDCNDNASSANPSEAETCGDSIDNDCDGNIDNVDFDMDGFVAALCGGLDCDDTRNTVFPGAEEVCNLRDDDCNGDVDDRDRDFDGFIDDDPICGGTDCDDDENSVNPGRLEICGDGLDNDCNGTAEDRDIDGDADFDLACGGTDCDDLNALANGIGAPETCGDGDDNDCNMVIDDVDRDNDNHIDELCALYVGPLPVDDCNDFSDLANPGETEVCGDMVDNDCDGSTDNRDIDGDNFIDLACGGTDCNDNESSVRPGALEVCDNLDNDCNMAVDDKDLDADGHIDAMCVNYVGALPIDDCDDTNVGVNPERFEVCGNLLDEDCSGSLDDKDIDRDGAIDTDPLCGGDDCDDGDPMSYPGAPEFRDGRNNDCDLDGIADEGLISSGDLVVTEILYNPTPSPDENYEWFEVFNPTDRPIELMGWFIHDQPGSSQEIAVVDASVTIPPRQFGTLCRTGDPAFNGGVDCDYQYGFMQLANSSSGDELILTFGPDACPASGGAGCVTVDEVYYNRSGWPNPNGESLIVSSDSYGGDNNTSAPWCASPPSAPTIPSGDGGSPGVSNLTCPNSGTDPAVGTVHPDNASSSGGATVRILGYGFTGTTAVRVGGSDCASFSVVSNSEITCVVPSGTAGLAAVEVVEGGASDSVSGAFTYTRTASTSAQRPDSWSVDSPSEVDFNRDTWSQPVFGQVAESGVTTGSCPASGEYAPGTLIAEVGFGATGTNPATDGSWAWFPAFCESISGGAATFRGAVTTPNPGAYSYVYRFSLDGGLSWAFADLDGSGNGFQVGQMGGMSVR